MSHIVDADPAAARAATARGVEALQTAGVKLIDATPHLVEAAGDERMYYWLDIHLTPEGNRVVAETAIPMLERWIDQGAGSGPAP